MSQDLRDSINAALDRESELWEYLIEHDEEEDFEKWVIEYRKRQDANH